MKCFDTLHDFEQKYPVKFGAGQCKSDMGPSSPVVYDTGDKDSTANLYGSSAGSIELYIALEKLM